MYKRHGNYIFNVNCVAQIIWYLFGEFFIRLWKKSPKLRDSAGFSSSSFIIICSHGEYLPFRHFVYERWWHKSYITKLWSVLRRRKLITSQGYNLVLLKWWKFHIKNRRRNKKCKFKWTFNVSMGVLDFNIPPWPKE